ncbi:hypothetical protein ACTHQ1_03585 [Janibacter anophelis]|uniref:hypothetical protein n=1 Tax=Janibacter anophelis TaxID=319054 RepID=UPI003F7E15CC
MALRFKTEQDLGSDQMSTLFALRQEVNAVDLTALAGDRLSTKGIRDAFTRGMARRGFTYDESLGAFIDARGVAITVHAGRAYTNNEVMWRLLQLAGEPRVRALIAVAPHVYKKGSCAPKVEQQLLEISRNPGLAIDLEWAAHVAYHLP